MQTFPKKTFIVILIIIFVGALILYLVPFPQTKAHYVAIRGAMVKVEIADTPHRRAEGLRGRSYLPEGAGMAFFFDHSDDPAIWMKGMRFPIDILWVRDGKVVDMGENVSPVLPGTPDALMPQYRPDSVADMVLEVEAGFVQKNNIQRGDMVGLVYK